MRHPRLRPVLDLLAGADLHDLHGGEADAPLLGGGRRVGCVQVATGCGPPAPGLPHLRLPRRLGHRPSRRFPDAVGRRGDGPDGVLPITPKAMLRRGVVAPSLPEAPSRRRPAARGMLSQSTCAMLPVGARARQLGVAGGEGIGHLGGPRIEVLQEAVGQKRDEVSVGAAHDLHPPRRHAAGGVGLPPQAGGRKCAGARVRP
mmetsp:Transcript_111426/g.311457  ORF Transcript_111426/g.311457 Transcript_111426/m.311457 type:complete len:202 (-) Transcript_111426:11-616(-)